MAELTPALRLGWNASNLPIPKKAVMPTEQSAPELERIESVKEEIRGLVPLLVGLVPLLLAFGIACGTPSPPTAEPPVLSDEPSLTALEPTVAVKSTAPLTTSSGLTLDEETFIRGVVTENYPGCTLDLPCFLRLLVNGQEMAVIYHFGEYPRCLNREAVDFGLETMVGDEVEAFGKVTAINEISTCDSRDYYIRKEP